MTNEIKSIISFCNNKFYNEDDYCGIGLKTTLNKHCLKWKNSEVDFDKEIEMTTLCKKGFYSYWCPTNPYKGRFNIEFKYDYCENIICQPNKINYCQSNILWSSTISTISLYFNKSENDYQMILLRYDNDNDNCFVNKICEDCGAINNILNNQLKPCQAMRNEKRTIIIKNLLDGTAYTYYLIPVINKSTIGTLIKLDLYTKIKKPSNIIVLQKTMNSVSLKWQNPARNELEYSIEVKGENYEQIFHTFGSTYVVKNLLPCREYCFSYWVINKLNSFNRSNLTCVNTEFKFGDINLKSIYENNSKSQLIEWTYNNEDNCFVVFNIHYYPLRFPNQTVNIQTKNTFINLKNFSDWGRYTIKVRPEVLNIHGKYSRAKEFNVIGGIYSSTNLKKEKSHFLLFGLLIFIILPISLYGFFAYKKVKIKKIIRISYVNSFNENEIMKVEYCDVEGSIMCSITNRSVEQFKNENFLKNENIQQEIINEFQNLMFKSDKLEEKLNLTTDIALLPENIKKNYNLSVIPYDQNRVILENHSTPSCYFNASYIPYCDDINLMQFIVCQPPFKVCVLDFWLMIWQQNISLIIMLRRFNYNTKFCHYWSEKNFPNNIAIDSSEFVVELDYKTKTDAYIERKFILKNKMENESRKITHLQMMLWSNFSNPKFTDLYNFHSRYHELKSIKSPPYLIHSNVGDGPTGVFITIDRIINKINERADFIDIYSEVSELRRQRRSMVQEKSQYLYIYEFIGQLLSATEENHYISMNE